MPRSHIDISGQQFGKLTAMSRSYDGKKSVWSCKCECGNVTSVAYSDLKKGTTRSCGCLKKTAKGLSSHPSYNIWSGMVYRCNNPKSSDYENYGGRGIKVCSRWAKSFETFIEDMGDRPKGFTIERIDVNGNYDPSNCVWASKKKQGTNTRKSLSNRIKNSDVHAILNLRKAGLSLDELRDLFGLGRDFLSGVIVGATLASPIQKSYRFKDVSLVPGKSVCESRLDTDISSEVMRGIVLDVPFIAANMSTVCNADFCALLEKLGAMGILHRAGSEDYLIAETKKLAKTSEIVAASVGTGGGQFELARSLVNAGANVITIDVANGYSYASIELARKIKNELPVKLILGNTTSIQMMYEVEDFVDAIKVGIAQGLACETANTAAVTEGQFSVALKFKEVSKKLGLPVISDGGIREPGDFVKALSCTNSAMAGSVFARCPESAGEIITVEDGTRKKVYAGMASRYVQDQWHGGLKRGTCPEGAVKYLDLGEPARELIERYSGALRSGITYSGGRSIKDLQDNAAYINIT